MGGIYSNTFHEGVTHLVAEVNNIRLSIENSSNVFKTVPDFKSQKQKGSI